MQEFSPHTFHIPVMGIAFTIDSPIKVACYGINSALSIIEDNLIEMMRKYYYEKNNEQYVPITTKEKDYRSRRITDYLDLINKNVQDRFEKLKTSAFETGSEIEKYFQMLPESSGLKQKYHELLISKTPEEKRALEDSLRNEVRPGSIEVNIMTKVDKVNFNKDGSPIEDGSDALEALKGYAKSMLKNSSVIFSAGMNPRLYNYLEKFREFDAKNWGEFDKRVVIKVSDYRSALIQGKYLAKKGIWVSEFRIESGLNCGGHAFATQGLLLGPILDEFKAKKEELADSLFSIYNPAIKARGENGFEKPHPIKITVQGGIGTFEEDNFLHSYYGIDSTGWGTPFLLCPEATTVDEKTLELLSRAKEKDVILSKNSPLGVRFNYLKGNTSEKEKLERIAKGVPGSPCTEKFLISNTEFTKTPICTASRKYQKLKIEQLVSADLPEAEYKQQLDEVLSKECLCIGLSNSASHEYEVPFVKKQTAVTICPGPNIVNFSKISSLQEMTDHIYGRNNIMEQEKRPHMFVKELELYIDYIKEQIEEILQPDARIIKTHRGFCNNLLDGISYYRQLLGKNMFSNSNAKRFEYSLNRAEEKLQEFLEKLHFKESERLV